MNKNRSGLMAFFAFIFILPAAAARAQVSTAAAAEVSSGTVPEQAAVTTAAAGAPTLAVQSLVDNSKLYADVNAAGITPEEKARRQAIKDRLSGILDIHEMARLILVKHWDKLTPAQRDYLQKQVRALEAQTDYWIKNAAEETAMQARPASR